MYVCMYIHTCMYVCAHVPGVRVLYFRSCEVGVGFRVLFVVPVFFFFLIGSCEVGVIPWGFHLLISSLLRAGYRLFVFSFKSEVLK